MKYLLTAVMVNIAILCNSQSFVIHPENIKGTLSFGAVKFNTKTEHSSDVGFMIGASVWRIYLDFSTNLASGRGEELDFIPDCPVEKQREELLCGNIGFIAATLFKESAVEIELIPVVGYYSKYNIYQNPADYPDKCYYATYGDDNINFGIVFRAVILDKAGLVIGISSMEKLKAGVVFRF